MPYCNKSFLMNALIAALSLTMLLSCGSNDKKTKVGVVLYHQFSWREKLANEINYASFRYENLNITTVSSNNSSSRQVHQIDSLVKEGIDLLIISPIPTKEVIDAINRCYDRNIPVVLVDNKNINCKYTAFIGADNEEIGHSVGEYIGRMLLIKGGKVLEVQGKAGDLATEERHRGFISALKAFPKVQVIASPHGNWNYLTAEDIVDKELALHDDISVVFYHSDGMVNYKLQSRYLAKGKLLRVIGIDALSKKPSGIEQVKKDSISASFVYPTRGDKVVDLAMKIINRQPYTRDEILPTGVVDRDNISTILQQHIEIDRLDSQIQSMRAQIDMSQTESALRLRISLLLSILVISLAVYCVTIYRSFKKKHELHATIKKQYAEKEIQAQKLLESNNRLLLLNQQIEEEVQTKLNFFTNVSHEFRTPLTLIAGPIEKLCTDEKLTESQRHSLLDVASKNLSTLMSLVSDILDFRKVQDGKMELRLEQFELVKALKDWTDNFRNYAISKNISLEFSHEKTRTLWVQADRKKMTSIVVNLLGNAFKHTPDGGRITVSLTFDNDTFTLKVCDTGEGIAPDVQPRIFDGFYQAPGTQSGTGLGLTFTKSLVELHHGTITAESTVGAGATLTVTMPIAQKREELEQKLLDDDKMLEEANIQGAGKPRVLIIDDNKDMCEYVRVILGNEYECQEAYNGKEGYEKALRWIPDIVVCDVMMPVMDGITCCQKLKTTTATSHIPVILLTARSLESNYIEGYDNGADAYITKPFSAEVLTARVENLLANRKLLRESFAHDDNKFEMFATPRESEFVKRFQDCIKENCSSPDLNIEDISSKMNLSRAQLYAKIKNLTGQAPVEHIRMIRLECSRELLRTTELTIAEIGYKVGFSSPAYFSKCFKDQYNMTPKEFRNQNQ